MPIPKPPYPAHFRQQMVELVQAGRKPAELSKEFGCHTSSILNWMRQGEAANGTTPNASGPLSADERKELIELHPSGQICIGGNNQVLPLLAGV